MNIVVGVDESQAGTRALRWAAAFAGRTGSSLQAVRTWAYPYLPGDGLADPNQMDRATMAGLRESLAALGRTELDIEATVLRGPAGPTLLGLIEQEKPSLVVVGRRGEDTPRTILGSVSRRLVEQAHAPVVVVSGDEHDTEDVRRVVVGVDGSEDADRALSWALEVAPMLGADLILVNAVTFDGEMVAGVEARYEASAEMLEDAKQRAESRGVGAIAISVTEDPRSALEHTAEEHQADLIVVGTRGLGGLGKLLLGSVASYLAQHVHLPVAVIPPERREPSPPGDFPMP